MDKAEKQKNEPIFILIPIHFLMLIWKVIRKTPGLPVHQTHNLAYVSGSHPLWQLSW